MNNRAPPYPRAASARHDPGPACRPCIAPPTSISAQDQVVFRQRTFRLTSIAGLGLPQVVIPVGTVSGCPVGLSFIGWDRSDETLLDLAVEVAYFGGVAVP